MRNAHFRSANNRWVRGAERRSGSAAAAHTHRRLQETLTLPRTTEALFVTNLLLGKPNVKPAALCTSAHDDKRTQRYNLHTSPIALHDTHHF